MLIFRIKKILIDRGFDPDAVENGYRIANDSEGSPFIEFWNDSSLGALPTARQLMEADFEVYLQRNEVKNSLPDPFDFMIAMHLSRHGDNTLLDELDQDIEQALFYNPKADLRSFAKRKRNSILINNSLLSNNRE